MTPGPAQHSFNCNKNTLLVTKLFTFVRSLLTVAKKNYSPNPPKLLPPKLFIKLCAWLAPFSFLLFLSRFTRSIPPEIVPKKVYLVLILNFYPTTCFFWAVRIKCYPSLSPTIKNTSFKSGIYVGGSVNFITNRSKNKLDGGSFGM